MSGVRTNLIVIESFDPSNIDSEYDFFQIINNGGKKFFLSDMVDEIFSERNICSVRYMPFDRDKNSVFLMMYHSDLNTEYLNKYLEKSGNENCKIVQHKADEMMQSWKKETIQLLFNSVKWMKIDGLRFNNITGRYLCTNRAWSKGSWGSANNSFIALELKINNEKIGGKETILIAPSVQTFTQYGDIPDYPHKQYAPQYRLNDDFSMQRAVYKSNENYINRQKPGQRNTLWYISLTEPKSFYKSRAYILLKAVELFNLKFDGKIRIDFDRWNQVKHGLTTKKSIEAFDSLLKDRVKHSMISVFDLICDEESKRCVDTFVSKFNEEFAIMPEISNDPRDGYLNVGINHNKDFFAENKDLIDPYNTYDNLVVNHITIEDFMESVKRGKNEKSKRAPVRAVAKELLIKEDLLNKQITLDDWSQWCYSGNMIFAKLHKVKDEKREDEEWFVYKMMIHCDGSFEMEMTSEDDEHIDKISEALFEITEKRNVEGAIMDFRGNINIIRRTDIITVPENAIIDIFDKNEKEGEMSKDARTAEAKNTITHGNYDIRVLMTADEMYYFVGDLSEMAHKDTNAPNVRCITPTEGSSVFFDNLLDLMKVPFVKYNMSTVLPYPFKYLDEHIEISTKKKQ